MTGFKQQLARNKPSAGVALAHDPRCFSSTARTAAKRLGYEAAGELAPAPAVEEDPSATIVSGARSPNRFAVCGRA